MSAILDDITHAKDLMVEVEAHVQLMEELLRIYRRDNPDDLAGMTDDHLDLLNELMIEEADGPGDVIDRLCDEYRDRIGYEAWMAKAEGIYDEKD